MNALIDTNVILDVLCRREPHFVDSARVLAIAERGDFIAWMGATTVTTLFYLVRRTIGTEMAHEKMRDLLAIIRVAPVNQSVIESATFDRFPDFEDAVLYHAACQIGASTIITRNTGDFRTAKLLIQTPSQFLATLRPH